MESLIDAILRAGRSAVEVSLLVLLPMMVVMLSLMRLHEARGMLDWLVERRAPLLHPLGLTCLGVVAALQISFVSFAALVATMEQHVTSDRYLATTLAMAMVQVNALFSLTVRGLRLGPLLAFSLLGGLVAAVATC